MDDPSASRTKEVQINEKLANEEYKIWKKQSPFIYDVCLTKALAWPSLTVEWFPDRPPYATQDNASSYFKTYSLLLGTHTLGNETDYVYKALVDLPSSTYDGKEPLINLAGESQKIVHKGEVNRARYSPLKPELIATMSNTGDAYVFDTNEYSSDSADGSFDPTLVLKHHKKEGWGIAWNYQNACRLATGAFDGTVAVWDIEGSLALDKGAVVHPEHVFTLHEPAMVNDVAWSPHFTFLLASAAEDNSIAIFDTRSNSVAFHIQQAHTAGVTCLSFNHLNQNLLASGSADTTVAIWDLRYINGGKDQMRLGGHSQDVTFVKWSPHDESVIATGGYDRHIKVWDLSLCGAPQTPEEEQEGPPELLFIHGGHVNKICEFDWHPSLPWTLASTSEDNVLQVWKIAGSIVDTVPDDNENEDEAEE